MEVLIGSVLLVSIFATLLVTFVSVRRYIRRANRRLIAVNGARSILNVFSTQIEANWDEPGKALTIGHHDLEGEGVIDNEVYRASYDVYGTSGSYRRVDMHMEYPD